MSLRAVTIVVTKSIVAEYEARSYPDEQKDRAGYYNLYKVPVYEIQVKGTDGSGAAAARVFNAPRFMPYYNNPARPDSHYSATGWVNSGLSSARTVVVQKYKADYEVQNRYSPGRGAIVVHKAFYIHAGPADLLDYGFGSAGCIEIIGNFDDFKGAIRELSGDPSSDADTAIQHLVVARKLTVIVEEAKVPNIRSAATRKVHD